MQVVIDQVKLEKPWKPLLLFIPLRLGIYDINPLYFSDVKVGKSILNCHALILIGINLINQ